MSIGLLGLLYALSHFFFLSFFLSFSFYFIYVDVFGFYVANHLHFF